MAEEKVVSIKIKSNIVEATEEVDELNKSLDKTEKKVDNVNDAGEGTSKLSKGFGKAGEAIDGLAPGLKGAISGMKAMLVQMWAIVANPIGLVVIAIVGGLTLLYKAFANSFEGGEKIIQVMAGIGAAGQALIDNLDKIGRAIVAVFTFNFSAAKKEIQSVVNATAGAFNKMAELTKRAQQLSRDQADNDFDAIKRQATLADLKDKLLDDSISFKEKKKIQAELLKASEENAKSDIGLARDIANNKIAQLTLQKDGAKKNYEEIKKIQGEQLKGEIENDRELKQIRKAGKTLDNEELARLKSINSEKKAEAKSLADEKKRIDDELTAAIVANAKRLKEIEDERVYQAKNANDQFKAIADANIAKQEAEMKAKADYSAWELSLIKFNFDEAKKIRDKQIEDEKAAAEAKQQIQNAVLDNIEGGISILKELGAKNKALQKAAVIAETAAGIARIIINTKVANAAAVLASPLTFGQPWVAINTISAGIGIAASLIASKKALSELGGGSVSSPSASVSSSSGSTTSNAPQFNVVGTSGINQIAQAVGKEQPPIKAFVVASEMTTAQSLERNIVKSSSLG